MRLVLQPQIVKMIKESQSSGDGTVITAEQADRALAPIVDYLNQQLSTLSGVLSDTMAQHVIYQIWLRCILTPLLGCLVPLSDSSTENLLGKAATTRQTAMIEKSLALLVEFFYAGGEGLGIPTTLLRDTAWSYQAMAELLPVYHQPFESIARQLQQKSHRPGMHWILIRLLRLKCSSDATQKSLLEELTAKQEAYLERGEIVP
jgi:hypothetical protein